MKNNKKIYLVVGIILLMIISIFYYNASQKRLDTQNLTPKEYFEKNK